MKHARLSKLTLLLALLLSLFQTPSAHAADHQSVYEQVLQRGTIRCAYFVVPPEFMKDPNTGKLSGIGYEVTEAAAKSLGLSVDWVEEVGFGEMAAGLKAHRYDAVCSSVFNRAPLAREAAFTIPFMYTPVGIFVRADDTRFDKNISFIDDPSVTIATIDGETANEIADATFPKAHRFSMPQNSGVSSLLESVAAKKADVTFTYMANFYNYNKGNPGKLKAVQLDQPLRAYGNTLMVAHGEEDFKDMLNSALAELVNSGAVDKIITKYETFPGTYYRITRPYQSPQKQ